MVLLSDTLAVVLSDSLTFDLFLCVCVCASDWPIVTGTHGIAIWRPHSCRHTSCAAHYGKKQILYDDDEPLEGGRFSSHKEKLYEVKETVHVLKITGS